MKDVAGNALATTRTWTFTTAAAGGGDTTAPTVTATSPAAGATGVAATANVTGTFSEAMNPSTITSTTFKLTGGVDDGAGRCVVHKQRCDAKPDVRIWRPIRRTRRRSLVAPLG